MSLVQMCNDVVVYLVPYRYGQRLFVRYDAINSVHMQVLLHRTVQAEVIGRWRRLGALADSIAAAEGFMVDVAYNGVQASRLRRAAWRKSRYSNPSGNCVEATGLPAGGVAVRNSRYPDGPALIFTRAEWDAFLLGARDGDFDNPEPHAG
jgi:hypothetical protein